MVTDRPVVPPHPLAALLAPAGLEGVMVPDPKRPGSIESWLGHQLAPRAVVIEIIIDSQAAAAFSARVRAFSADIPMVIVSRMTAASLQSLRADVYLSPEQAQATLARTVRDLIGMMAHGGGVGSPRAASVPPSQQQAPVAQGLAAQSQQSQQPPRQSPPSQPQPPPPRAASIAPGPTAQLRAGSLPVNLRLDSWDQYVVLYTGNLSRGGMFVRMAEPPPVGSPVHLRIALPGGDIVELPGEVSHVVKTAGAATASGGQRPGIGIKLDPFSAERQAQLSGFLARVNAPAGLPSATGTGSQQALGQGVPTAVAAHGSGGAQQAPPPATSSELARTLASRLAELRRQDAFTALGLPRDTDVDGVRKTFLTMAKVWHPSRFALEPDEVRELVADIFIVLRRAHDTLSDEGRIVAYRQRLDNPGNAYGTRSGGQTVPRAQATPTTPPPNLAPRTDGAGQGRAPLPMGVHISGAGGAPLTNPQGRTIPASGAPTTGTQGRTVPPTGAPTTGTQGRTIPASGAPTTGTQGRTIPPAGPPSPTPSTGARTLAPVPTLDEADLFAGVEVDLGEAGGGTGGNLLPADREISEGMALLKAGNNASARTAFERGLQHDGQNRELRALHAVARGREAMAAGQLEQATQLLQSAVSMYPSCVPALESLRQLNDVKSKQKRSLLERLLDRRGGGGGS